MSLYKYLTITGTIAAVMLIPASSFAETSIKTDISKTVSNVSNEMSDTAITAKVKTLLAMEPDIKSFSIEVTTKDHVVHLNGHVDKESQASKIVEIARGVNGVKSVHSDISVKNTVAPSIK